MPGWSLGPRERCLRAITRLTRVLATMLVAAPVASASTGPVRARTFYVSPAGSNRNRGTSPERPWRTVGKVNSRRFAPGDTILFEGGATFSDHELQVLSSGRPRLPITFGSYGRGQATLTLGAWFHRDWLVFKDLRLERELQGGSTSYGPANDITVDGLTIEPPPGNQTVGLYAQGDDWRLEGNTIEGTGLSGMLLTGNRYSVVGNRISDVGRYDAGYPAHGIYLDASNATVAHNIVTGCAESCLSVRYGGSDIVGNTLRGAAIGIEFLQTDPSHGWARWEGNRISRTRDAGIYVSAFGAHPLSESFVIERNDLAYATGAGIRTAPTSGRYVVAGNRCNGVACR